MFRYFIYLAYDGTNYHGWQIQPNGSSVQETLMKANPEGKAEKSKITIPWFAFGFIGIICLNSLLQYLTGAETVKDIPLNGAIEYIDTFMLTMAMTALGTDTSLEKFKQAGAKPFLLAGLLYIWLVGGGYLLTQYITPMFG